MSNYPTSIDNDSTIPTVYDNITEVGAEAVNALKEAVINIESELGMSLSGSVSDLGSRLNVALNPDGTIKSSALTSLGLVTLPITNDQISPTAQIEESKLSLDYSTSTLNTSVTLALSKADSSLNWISINSPKFTSHIDGTAYFHTLSQIKVYSSSSGYLKNKYLSDRDNTNSYTLISDINSDFVDHQRKDGTTSASQNVTTLGGSNYPDNFSHTAGGIYINPSTFSTIPQTTNSLQKLAEFIDNTSIFLYGSRVQNFYSNGVSNASRSVRFGSDTLNVEVIPTTTVITYLRSSFASSSPVDDFNTGDDLIEFTPETSVKTSNTFDTQFSLVNIGDIVVVNYGSIESEFIIKEKKYISTGNKKFIVRINGINLKYSTTATAKIVRKKYNTDKQHVLALATAQYVSDAVSLTAIHPRSPSVLGIGFNPNSIDPTHYNLYLVVYTNGNIDSSVQLPAIDVTGNQGTTPGKYTLESVIKETNKAFRLPGYNYRFAAFEKDGEFGIAMTDPYENTGFSVISAMVNSLGSYDQTNTYLTYPNNVIDVFAAETQHPKDPLGYGPSAANVASPPYLSTYSSPEASIIPTKVFFPLKRNYYYVNGTERDSFSLEVNQITDGYGDGYWISEVINKNEIPGDSVEVTYRVQSDLTTSSLQIGKTLVIQPMNDGYFIDSGRFIIKDINSNMCDGYSDYTDITVYDAVYGQGSSPETILDIGSKVRLYFSFDSIGFNLSSSNDNADSGGVFKRYFEVFADENGKTFSHERARLPLNSSNITVNDQTLYCSSNASNIDICYVSSKLKGYKYGSISKINISVDYNSTTGLVLAYLSEFNGLLATKRGPFGQGFIGQKIRLYDESNIEYIDIRLNIDSTAPTFSFENISLQLYNSLELDQELFLLGSCQVNGLNNDITILNDLREFGNVSEKDLSGSLVNFIGMGEKYLHSNGVVSGFDISADTPNPSDNEVHLSGGIASVNGKFILMNPDFIRIPVVKENISGVYYNVLWALCLNDKSEYFFLPITDIQYSGNYTASSRKVKLTELSTATDYYTESTTFEKLLLRKDVVVLYLVNSVISGSGPYTTALKILDYKKYSYSTDSYSAKYTDVKEFGNFRSADAIFNNLRFNGSNITSVNISGISDAVSSAISLTQSNKIEIFGGSTSDQISIDELPVTFKNAYLRDFFLSVSNTSNNVVYINDNCTLDNIEITIETSGDITVAGYAIQVGNNVKFNNCIFNIYYDGALVSGEKFIKLAGSNIEFNGCTFTSSFSPVIDTIPYYIWGQSLSNIKITNCSFSGEEKSSIYLNNCSSVLITDNIFDTALDASTYDSSYVSANPCNFVCESIVHINNTTSNNNITIINNKFTSAIASRKDFCSVVFTGDSFKLRNILISNNYFEDTSSSATQHTALSFIYTGTSNSARVGFVDNCVIDNNHCNKDQGMLFTSKAHTDNKMYLKLIPISVNITNNTFGSIGYYGGSAKKITSISNNHTGNRYSAGIKIENNTANLIFLANHKGFQQFISTLVAGVTQNMTTYPTTETLIDSNRASYIFSGVAYNSNSSLKITNNHCPALDEQWLVDNIAYSWAGGNTVVNYSIIVDALKHNASATASTTLPANDEGSACVISGNTINQGFWINSSSVAYLEQPFGYIYSKSSCIIENNHCRDTQGNITHLISVGAANCVIKGNNISRNGTDNSGSTQGYFGFYNDESTTWTGANSQGLVVDNIMDTEYLNSSLADNLVKDKFPNTWTVTRNINQMGYQNFPIISDTTEYIPGGTTESSLIDNDVVLSRLPDGSSRKYTSLINTLFCSNTTQDKLIQLQYNLNQYLPDNVRIISAVMKIKKVNTGTLNSTLPASEFRITINRLTTPFSNQYASIDLASLSSTDTFVESSSLVSDSLTHATYNPAANSTVFTLSLATIGGATEKFVVNDRSPILLSFHCLFQVATGNLDAMLSPIVVKYKW